MPPLNVLVARIAIVESIALFAMLFAVADDSVLTGLGVMACTVLLCVVALRGIGSDSFTWLPWRGALVVFAVSNVAALALVAGQLAS